MDAARKVCKQRTFRKAEVTLYFYLGSIDFMSSWAHPRKQLNVSFHKVSKATRHLVQCRETNKDYIFYWHVLRSSVHGS
ncbi:unnamed protein product [Allacma fusca]|uniref:Uncharacterized protein n=1 Tax=Allacma fusca TaxID=39272 RepID=A0A8J2Q176_9HEXA|nr:unnamed protein product [Allacma fusca]